MRSAAFGIQEGKPGNLVSVTESPLARFFLLESLAWSGRGSGLQLCTTVPSSASAGRLFEACPPIHRHPSTAERVCVHSIVSRGGRCPARCLLLLLLRFLLLLLLLLPLLPMGTRPITLQSTRFCQARARPEREDRCGPRAPRAAAVFSSRAGRPGSPGLPSKCCRPAGAGCPPLPAQYGGLVGQLCNHSVNVKSLSVGT
mmetsp:Transcript_102014/g.277300  ORF Transcript_102014/g.277300 Transcript_102014/m.277300 type:complete len:200 (+) Transcript_102014:396-995(+)